MSNDEVFYFLIQSFTGIVIHDDEQLTFIGFINVKYITDIAMVKGGCCPGLLDESSLASSLVHHFINTMTYYYAAYCKGVKEQIHCCSKL